METVETPLDPPLLSDLFTYPRLHFQDFVEGVRIMEGPLYPCFTCMLPGFFTELICPALPVWDIILYCRCRISSCSAYYPALSEWVIVHCPQCPSCTASVCGILPAVSCTASVHCLCGILHVLHCQCGILSCTASVWILSCTVLHCQCEISPCTATEYAGCTVPFMDLICSCLHAWSH